MTKFKITYPDPLTENHEGYSGKIVEFKDFEDSPPDPSCDRRDCPWGYGWPSSGGCRRCERLTLFQSVTAREWAENYAYTKADKGPYTVEEVE